ncbi:hypothetical protein GOP47_0030899, partial [Adiantum capillus-veneris]
NWTQYSSSGGSDSSSGSSVQAAVQAVQAVESDLAQQFRLQLSANLDYRFGQVNANPYDKFGLEIHSLGANPDRKSASSDCIHHGSKPDSNSAANRANSRTLVFRMKWKFMDPKRRGNKSIKRTFDSPCMTLRSGLSNRRHPIDQEASNPFKRGGKRRRKCIFDDDEAAVEEGSNHLESEDVVRGDEP